MPETKEGLDVPIRVRLEGDGSEKAAAGLRKVKDAAEETSAGLRTMRDVGHELKEALAELVAVAELVKQFREGSEQIANMEQTMNVLRLSTEKNKHSFAEVKKEIEDFARSLTEAAGFDDDVAIPAMVKLYQVTGDVAKSIDLMRIAADVSIGANIELGEASSMVARAAMGSTRELRQLNITIEESLPKKEKARLALQLLEKRYGGAASEAKGLRVEQNRLSEAWEDVRNKAVEPLANALVVVARVGLTAMHAIVLGLQDIGLGAKALADLWVGMGKVMWTAIKGDLPGAKAALAELIGTAKENWGTFQELQDRFAEQTVELWKTSQEKVDLGTRKSRDLFIHGEGEKKQAVEDTMVAHVHAWERYLEKVRELNAKELKEYQKNQLLIRKIGVEELKETLDRRQKEADAEQRMREKSAETAHKFTELRKQQELDLARGVIGLTETIFGQSKATAIAQAIINTYEGATKALAQGGAYGPALAALVIATGLAQVATIVSTEPGGGVPSSATTASASGGETGTGTVSGAGGRGFDDHGNDAAARAGGYRWAKDMVSHWGAGASAGWQAGMLGAVGSGGNGTTVDNSRTYSVQIAVPGVQDPTTTASLKRFGRHLSQVEKQIEGARVISRRRS